jgi:hypothetical protein
MSIKPLNTSNFQTPKSFLSTMQTLQNQLPSILDDFSQYYVFYYKNPNDTEYQQMFSNIKSNLNNIHSQLFSLSNNVDSNTNTISKELLSFNKEIQLLKTQNDKLKKKIGIANQKNGSANEMIYNYKQLYDIGYVRNWGILLSILLSFTILSVLFKKNKVPSISSQYVQ